METFFYIETAVQRKKHQPSLAKNRKLGWFGCIASLLLLSSKFFFKLVKLVKASKVVIILSLAFLEIHWVLLLHAVVILGFHYEMLPLDIILDQLKKEKKCKDHLKQILRCAVSSARIRQLSWNCVSK